MKNVTTTLLMLFASISFAQSFNSQKLDSLFLLLEKNNKYMGSIAISQDQKTIYKNAIGFVDVENGIKTTVDSTSKCNFMVYKFINYIFRVFIL